MDPVTTVPAASGGGGGSEPSNGDKGDVTVSGAGLIWAIDADAVSNSKLANMAASTIKSNVTGGAADPVDNSITAVLDLASSTRGAIPSRGAATWGGISPGTSGHVLTSNGAGADPTYQAVSGGVSDGDKGDVTVSASGATWTIDAGAITTAKIGDDQVTLAKIADQATLTILANVTGGSASPAASSLSAIIDACIGSTRGQVLYRGASGWAALSPGTSGYALKSNGSGADPSYGAVAAMTALGSTTLGGAASSITVGSLTMSASKRIRITLNGTITLTAAATLTLQINGAATNINHQGQYSNGFGNLFEFHNGATYVNYTGSATTDPFSLVITCEKPSTGQYRTFHCQGNQWNINAGTNYASTSSIVYVDTATAITSFALVASAGTPLDSGLKMVVEEYDGGQ